MVSPSGEQVGAQEDSRCSRHTNGVGTGVAATDMLDEKYSMSVIVASVLEIGIAKVSLLLWLVVAADDALDVERLIASRHHRSQRQGYQLRRRSSTGRRE